MFERFTEKAVNVVIESQRLAKVMECAEVLPEHLLLAIVNEAKGVSRRILRMYGVTSEAVQELLNNYIIKSYKSIENIPFSHSFKDILKRTLDIASKSNNSNILAEHLFLAVLMDRNSNIQAILEKFNFDTYASREILNKIVQRKIKKLEHPETEEDDEKSSTFDSVYDSEALTDVFSRAVAKLSTSGYEILGTEQIVESILEDSNSQLTQSLEKYGISLNSFKTIVAEQHSRQDEFEDKKIIFTPNAFRVMNTALQIAKELGASSVTPEHIVLSLLQSKKGIAYNIFKELGVNENGLSNEILKPIEKQMSETLTIMKLSKEEAQRIGRNVVGTEMILLGIIAEGTSVAFEVLNDLEVTLKDARSIVENIVGYGNEYFEKDVVFTNRAKRVLEKAWISAKKYSKQKIEAVDLLYAIIDEPNSVAMKVLDQLGVDTVEIKHGIQGIK